MTKKQTSTQTTTQYVVLYGPRPVQHRKKQTFSDPQQAKLFFLEQQRLGLWVDVERHTTTLTVERLTDPEH